MTATRRDRQLTVLHGGHFPRCSARVDKDFEGYFSLQFMEEGTLRLSYDGTGYQLAGAWVWFSMPGPRIRFTTADGRPWNHRYIAFRGPLAEWWFQQRLITRQPLACPESEKARLAWLFDEVFSRFKHDEKWGRLRTVNLIENLLVELEDLRHPGPPSRKGSRLATMVRRAWEETPAEPVDYEGLARRGGLALSTFRRHFFRETGLAVHRYVMRLKIEQARRLLIDGDQSVEQIADTLGFNDVFYFTRCFRNAVGIPPARYRRTRLAGA